MSQTAAKSAIFWSRKAVRSAANSEALPEHNRRPMLHDCSMPCLHAQEIRPRASRRTWVCPLGKILLWLVIGTPAASTAAVPVLAGPGAPFDLPISGMIANGPKGATMHLSRASLMELPSTTVDVTGEFGTTARKARAVFLADLVNALPLSPDADLLIAECSDGYISVYPISFIRRYRPFLVLEIDGKGPQDWPPPGLADNPGPYAITVSDKVVPGASAVRDVGHKEPWGVVALRFTSVTESFGGLFRGRWASAGPSERSGREIWIHSCASCHPGPDGVAGGTKSGRPFAVVEAFAGADAKFFRQYVRNPVSLMPGAKMEPHPRYTDAELDELISFLVEKAPSS